MMRLSVLFLIAGLCFWGCDQKNQQKVLQAKEDSLEQKAQALNAKEQELALREAALLQKEHVIDSAATADTVQVMPPAVAGTWNVQMTCTEATCAGSAVGDSKTEVWEIAYQGNTIVAQATAGNQLVRVYTGSFRDGTIQLDADLTTAASPTLTKMAVRLKPVSKTRLEGEREIIRENNCRIVYALQLDAATK